MATIQMQIPQPFDFSRPDEWSRWKRRFEQFRYASGLSQESGERQVSTLLYCLGQDADDVLRSTNIAEDKRKDYQEVLAKFDAFFGVRKNVIFQRACFNRRTQQADESVEQYIAAALPPDRDLRLRHPYRRNAARPSSSSASETRHFPSVYKWTLT